MTEGSGSGRPKNMWIRWSRIPIRNTAFSIDKLPIPIVYYICFDRTLCHGAVAEGRYELGTFWISDLDEKVLPQYRTGKGHQLCWNLGGSFCCFPPTCRLASRYDNPTPDHRGQIYPSVRDYKFGQRCYGYHYTGKSHRLCRNLSGFLCCIRDTGLICLDIMSTSSSKQWKINEQDKYFHILSWRNFLYKRMSLSYSSLNFWKKRSFF